MFADIDWNPIVIALAAAIPGIVASILSKIGNNKVDRLHDCVDQLHRKFDPKHKGRNDRHGTNRGSGS
jgi:hypothetical protein